MPLNSTCTWKSKRFIYLNVCAYSISIPLSLLYPSSQVVGMLLFRVTPVGSLETILAQPLWRNSSVNSIDPPRGPSNPFTQIPVVTNYLQSQTEQNFPASKNPYLILATSSLLYSSCEITVIFGHESWFLG